MRTPSWIKIHFHTYTPWKLLEYAASLGDVHDVAIKKGCPIWTTFFYEISSMVRASKLSFA
ncbi:hypothetical protein [Fusibacter sp. 3D3]|uniref:hypothetical protein n=1 Tax=Fusibacter sp. 3D3 TaxID=1048380 RepID=UPI0008553C9D|nr:hypothetical protein [Fusibacter sp. 3D3]GAU79436.1 hypothetical protein F3D3_4100 [Fusibacter sp. 3D3]